MDTQEQNQIEKTDETSKPKKMIAISTPAAIVTAGVIIALALMLSGKVAPGETKNNQQPGSNVPEQVAPTEKVSIRPTDHVRGDLTKAEVVIVEYSDSDCPYCQRFHVTMKEALKKNGTKVAWIYRHFPLDMHPNAINESIAMECVASRGGNESFWNYLDQLVDITITPDKSASILTSMATAVGVDAKAFTACTSNPDIKTIVDNQTKEAESLGARGTPYSIAFNKSGTQVVIPGAVPFEELQKTINDLLK